MRQNPCGCSAASVFFCASLFVQLDSDSFQPAGLGYRRVAWSERSNCALARRTLLMNRRPIFAKEIFHVVLLLAAKSILGQRQKSAPCSSRPIVTPSVGPLVSSAL